MTQYESWVVGGKTVPHVREVVKNPSEGKITLSCSALNWNELTGDDDPRDEIAYFEAMTSQYINNNPLLNGGTDLQIGNGQFITVTDGYTTWSTCALAEIEIKEDNASEKRIDYDLNIYYEIEGSGGSYIYLADDGYSNDFTNMVCYQASTKAGSPCTTCTNFGWLEITETVNVRRVEIYGSAYRSYNAGLAWIECNGSRQYWNYNAEGDLPVGFEKLVWDITPGKTITLQTSNHVSPFTTTDGLGCWLQWIKVIYE
jgi:hypothetical protein